MRWEWIALGYASYLAVVALVRPRFAVARRFALPVAAGGWAWLTIAGVPLRDGGEPDILGGVVVPACVLVFGYWLSRVFFVRPNVALERRLLCIDQRLLAPFLARFRAAPRVVQGYFELSYLLVYLVVPAGAATLVFGGHSDDVGSFWAVVLWAEFASYGMLPWIQTRPPRVLEGPVRPESSITLVRRLNLGVLSLGRAEVNTVPSGHAAGAMATALAVGSIMPAAGALFLGLAASIVAATILGRYHYVIDSVLGVLVALAAWTLG